MATKKQELIAFKILDKNGTDFDGNKFEVGKKYTTKDLNESSETDTSPIELLKGGVYNENKTSKVYPIWKAEVNI